MRSRSIQNAMARLRELPLRRSAVPASIDLSRRVRLSTKLGKKSSSSFLAQNRARDRSYRTNLCVYDATDRDGVSLISLTADHVEKTSFRRSNERNDRDWKKLRFITPIFPLSRVRRSRVAQRLRRSLLQQFFLRVSSGNAKIPTRIEKGCNLARSLQ